MGTVRVRNSIGYVHDIDERIFRAFPDDYRLVEDTTGGSGSQPPAPAATAAPTTTPEGVR